MGMGIAVFALVLLVVGLICFSLNESGEKEVPPVLSADWVNTYGPDQDVKMVQDADLICVGTVVDSYTELRGEMVFTKQVVEVERADKQLEQEKDCDAIEILQTGGSFGDVKTPAFTEAPLLEKGEKYYLLLQSTEEGHYLPMGGFQGVGEINTSGKVTFSDECKSVFSTLNEKSVNEMNREIEAML